MIKQNLKISGQVRMVCKDKDGNLKWDTGWFHNGITTAGKAAVSGLVSNLGGFTAFSYLAVGTSNTAFSAAQTTLQAEITDSGLARHTATVSRTTTTTTNDTIVFDYTWTASGTKSVEEVGIFNAASSGDMLGRALTTTKSLTSTDTLHITYNIIFA